VPFIPIFLAILAAVVISRLRPAAPHGGMTGAMSMPAADRTHAVDVGDKAPDFTLTDVHGEAPVTLSQLADKGPVLLIYYLGYSCPRCVANLHEIAGRKDEFDKLGVQIVAASPNTVAETRDSINTYADFPFPLLADPQLKVARAYGLEYGDTLLHGAFAVDPHRTLQFAMKSSHPYDNIDNLLGTFKMIKAQQ
jgi:peroxiredoxin